MKQIRSSIAKRLGSVLRTLIVIVFLTQADGWPESVTISEWYRIPPSDDRRQQAGAGARSDAAPAAARANDEVTAVKTPASVSAPAIQGPSNPTASSVNSATDEDIIIIIIIIRIIKFFNVA